MSKLICTTLEPSAAGPMRASNVRTLAVSLGRVKRGESPLLRQNQENQRNCDTPEIITPMASACAVVVVNGVSNSMVAMRQTFMTTGVAATLQNLLLLFKMPPCSETSDMNRI